ncbi:FixH family protein [Niallia sp. 03133]|uniref:FixH family protein n=1 Tax=Niallia sp. 03133 TaxID=3458060 RepID=UPI0040450EB5
MNNLHGKGVFLQLVKNRGHLYMVVCMLCLLLNACSLREDSKKSYKKETPLRPEIILPDPYSVQKQETIKIILSLSGGQQEYPDSIQVDIWKQDGSYQNKAEAVQEKGNGIYLLKKSFDLEGLYFLKLTAGSKDSIIMPTKQFIVGRLTESDQEFLRENAPKEKTIEHHHH